MKLRKWSVIVMLVLCVVWLFAHRSRSGDKGSVIRIEQGNFISSASFDATLDAKNVETVMSRFQGKATLIRMAPEGGTVTQGELLVQFDDSDIQSDLVKQRQTLARAQAELDSLEQGEIPLELKDLDVQLAEAKQQCEFEKRIMEDTRVLVEKNLISAHEVEQEEAKLATAVARVEQLEQRRTLIVEHIHPAKLTQARSDVDAAQKQVEQLERQLTNCTVASPCAGLVVYLPLHFANEYRTARVGDSMYPNQPFLCLPDMTAFIAICYVPEADLARIKTEGEAEITPVAYPDCHLKGRVESVGMMAQTQPGLPSWQKYLRVVFKIDGTDARLRPGMSLRVESISRRADGVTLIPRVAVRWDRGLPYVLKAHARKGSLTPVRLGEGNDRFFEVLEGLSPGDRVVLP